MKKIALLLAALLVFGMLAGCNAEEEKKTPDHVVPGYSINLYTGDGWTVAEESQYDLELSKDGVTMMVMGFISADFVDMPAAADLYLQCNDDLFEEMTEVTVKEKESTYKVEGNKLISTLFSAKSGDSTAQYYCFMVDFDDEADSMAWVCFTASAKVMKSKKADLKAIVDEMYANGEAVTQEELDAEMEELLGEEEPEATDGYEEDPTPTDGENDLTEPADGGESSAAEDIPAEEDPAGEVTESAETTTGAEEETTEASTEATETTEASTEATE